MKKRRVWPFILALEFLLLICANGFVEGTVAGGMDFIDHGVASPVSESRGIVAACDANGRPIILACAMDNYRNGLRTSLLVIDIETGHTDQYWYPAENSPNGAVYSLILSKKNRLYIMPESGFFLEFDVESRKWTFAQQVSGETAMSFAEGPDGVIYAATYPNCHLLAFDPQRRTLTDFGRLDPTEKYPSYLAVDSSGWVYCGIGTSRGNLVAFNPDTKELRQIVRESDRTPGSGDVYLGADGKVYGRASGDGIYYQLFEGKATPFGFQRALGAQVKAINWGGILDEFPSGGWILQFSLPERWAEIRDAAGNVRRITFDYKSEGTLITSLVSAPDGKVYGSTAHPMHFFMYDPKADRLEDWGGINRIGGGNFCDLAIQGDKIFGAAYCGGFLYSFDLTRPWNNEMGADPNPRFLAEYRRDIARPRTLLAHPDGRHVVMAGFPNYGYVGGGIAIYDAETGESTLLADDAVLPGHSTITLRALPNGDLVGGTSVEAPGGGQPVATEGVLYIMDWKTKKVTFKTEPVPGRTIFGNVRVPGAREICSIEIGPDGLVYGLGSKSEFFVFDPVKKEIVHRANLSEYGSPVRPDQSLILGPDNNIYALFSNGIVRIVPGNFEHKRCAIPPSSITAGVAIQGNRLYFACGSHLWSYGINGNMGEQR